MSCGCTSTYKFQPATRNAAWEGFNIFFPPAERAVAVAIRFVFFAPGATTPTFVMDETNGASILDPVAWSFSGGGINQITFPAGTYSWRLEVDTDAGPTEIALRGTWQIAP